MAPGRMKHWFLNRFVLIAEVLGYVLALTVILGAISTLFINVDILLPVSGQLTPLHTTITLDEDCAVATLEQETGSAVASGAPVAMVVTKSGDMLRVMGIRKVRDGLTLLGVEDSDALGEVLKTARTWLGNAASPRTTTLTAPMNGLVKPSDEALDGDRIPAGKPVATIYDLNTLTMRAILPDNRVDRVARDMPARASYPSVDQPLEGRVISLTTDEDGTHVDLRFEDVPEPVKRAGHAAVFGDGGEGLPTATADIVIGEQTLFSKLFSKRQ